jgi:hypothetical protein
MESAFGADFGGVRVHTGGAAARSARALQAAAYTTGDEIVFDEGAYEPGTARGRHLIAHELAHVVQQRAGAVDGTDAGDGITVSDPSDRFERAADQTARAISRGQRRRSDRPAGPDVPSPATVLALQRTAGNAAVAAWAANGLGDGFSSDVGGAAKAHGNVAMGGPIQRYSVGEFVSDVEGAAGSVAGAAESAYDAAVDTAQGAVDWVADAAGSAALSAAQGLVGAFGGSLVVTPTGFVIRIDDISLCDPFEVPILSAPPQRLLWPFPPYPIPIPPDFALILYGGLELSGTPSMTAHLGPCYLRNISIVFDFFSGTYSANGEWYVGAAISELLELQSTVIGGALLMLVAPPVPLIWADVGAGLRLFLRGSALGGLQSTQSLTYNSGAGSVTFSTLNSLMLGALIEADLDGFVNFSVYGFQICEWVWPLWHWEMGDAIRFDLPITLGYGTGGPPVSVGPITSTPIPYTDIEVVIDRTRPGTTCVSLDDIIAELCRLGVLPPDLCPGGGGLPGGGGGVLPSGCPNPGHARTVNLQPIFFRNDPADPAPTGGSWGRRLGPSNTIWGKLGVSFVDASPIMRDDPLNKNAGGTRPERDRIRATYNGSAIGVFMMNNDIADAGGGATTASGTSRAKVVLSDLGSSNTLLAHELGHVLGLGHPPGDADANTIMQPSGSNSSPNPTRNTMGNYMRIKWPPPGPPTCLHPDP